MAEIATIARPYADALFKAAGADAAGTAVWLDELAAIASNEQLRQFADSPKASSEQVFGVITGVLKAGLSTPAQNFLRIVIENGRLSALPEIAAQFRSLKNAQSGSSDAVVYSAFPIDGGALADVASTLESRFGRKLIKHCLRRINSAHANSAAFTRKRNRECEPAGTNSKFVDASGFGKRQNESNDFVDVV